MKLPGGIIICQTSRYSEIPDVLFFPGHQEYVTGNTSQTPKILIFEITAIAPFKNLHGQSIISGFQVFSDVKLGRGFTILTITDLLFVYPYIHGRTNGPEMQDNLLVFPVFGNGKGTFVRSHRIVMILDFRRSFFVWILHIGINRVGKTFQFKIGRYLYSCPVTGIKIILKKVVRTF